jgi:hypothetical protein
MPPFIALFQILKAMASYAFLAEITPVEIHPVHTNSSRESVRNIPACFNTLQNPSHSVASVPTNPKSKLISTVPKLPLACPVLPFDKGSGSLFPLAILRDHQIRKTYFPTQESCLLQDGYSCMFLVSMLSNVPLHERI